MPPAKPKRQRLASLGVAKPRFAKWPRLAGNSPSGPQPRLRRDITASRRDIAVSSGGIAAPRRWLAAPLAVTLAVTLSCGDDATGPTPTPTPQPTAVRVTPAETQLIVGDSVQLAAVVRDQNDQVMTGVTVTWASSDMAVASVTPAGLVRAFPSGLVHAVGGGSITVTATAGQASGSAAITVATLADRDRAALVALYEATGGSDWNIRTGWLTDAPIEQWHGVSTDSSGSVRWLELGLNGLAGALPPELGSLANLTYLNLGNNQLAGPIPPELGNLGNLTFLNLTSSQLTGTIPSELGNLAGLETLWLAINELSGPIPPELGNLGNLANLDLFQNELTGTIPPELGNISRLELLGLQSNKLTGAFPATLVRLDQLQSFSFDDNAGLCAPGTGAFVEWLKGLRTFAGDYCNLQDVAALEELYKFTGGTNWSNSSGWLEGPALDEWHGIAADSLGRVVRIDLEDNGLAGRLPADLGQLAEMRELRIGNNSKLAGPLPATLASLELAGLHYTGTELCSLDTPAFRDWLATVASHEGTGTECMYTERDMLASLYYSTGGAGWTNSDKWLTDAPVGEWYGVTADGDASVRGLNLDENGLEGKLPAELGGLGNIVRISLADNSLEGEIPPEFGNLANLETLRLHGALTNRNRNQLTGPIPAELANLANLADLRLSGNKLDGEIPPALGTMSRLTNLRLDHNELSGGIPAELASLARLRTLDLGHNKLTGPVPPELGDLANLAYLALGTNRLSGSIPAALGNLARLDTLALGRNKFEGTIPPEVVRLPSLRALDLEYNRLRDTVPVEFPVLERMILSGNRFTGMIPAALGSVSSLKEVYLDGNRLTGGIPAELGSLGDLVELELSNNRLAGPVPAELGALAKLRKFSVSNNSGLAGALPTSLTGLGTLSELLTGGTALCAPADPAFLAWLDAIRKRRVSLCEPGRGSAAYLAQAVQSLAFPVPLVAGKPALLRVFVSAPNAAGEGMPPVRARFYRDGSEVHIVNIAAPSASIPTSLNEGDLEVSANASIPASVVQPGLEMVVEIDPDGTLDASLGIVRRIPAEGRAAVSVRAVPELDFTIVPLLWREAPDSGVVRLTADLTADDVALLGPTKALLPVRDIDLKVHEPVMTGSNEAYDLLATTVAIRALEGAAGDEYYMGSMSGAIRSSLVGLAYTPGRASFSVPQPLIMAHELGHNFSLLHAPCGAVNADPGFPTLFGTIGAWGYDMLGDSLVAPGIFDLMSYCPPVWISDYHFTAALGYRVLQEGAGAARAVASGAAAVADGPERALLLWGGIGEGGEPFLEPAFVADVPPSLPESPGGEYAISGHDADGRELFSLSFDMPVLSHGDGRSAFAYALPARQEWAGSLVGITLSGPGGSFTLDKSSDRAAAILRDPLTGQVRGIFRDAPLSLLDAAGMAAPLGPTAAAALSLEPGLEVLASRGIPRPEDWRR